MRRSWLAMRNVVTGFYSAPIRSANHSYTLQSLYLQYTGKERLIERNMRFFSLTGGGGWGRLELILTTTKSSVFFNIPIFVCITLLISVFSAYVYSLFWKPVALQSKTSSHFSSSYYVPVQTKIIYTTYQESFFNAFQALFSLSGRNYL